MRYSDAIELTHQLAKTCRIPNLMAQTWGTHSLASEGIVFKRGEPLSQRERDMQFDTYVQKKLPSLFEAAEPYYVDRGLVDVIERMAPALPDAARLWRDLFPSPLGCLFFDRPIEMPPRRLHDAPGMPSYEPAPLSGFAWQADDVGAVLVHIYSWAVDGATPNYFRGTYIGNIPLSVVPWDFREYTLGDYIKFHNDRIVQSDDGDTNNAQRFAIAARVCVATLMLMAQRLTVCSKMPVDRPTARRALRAGWLFNNVQVVSLRKIDYSHSPDHDVRNIDWSCRWHVREHVRVYNRGTTDERHVMVKSYVKGPAGAPLKPLGTRVWAVVR